MLTEFVDFAFPGARGFSGWAAGETSEKIMPKMPTPDELALAGGLMAVGVAAIYTCKGVGERLGPALGDAIIDEFEEEIL